MRRIVADSIEPTERVSWTPCLTPPHLKETSSYFHRAPNRRQGGLFAGARTWFHAIMVSGETSVIETDPTHALTRARSYEANQTRRCEALRVFGIRSAKADASSCTDEPAAIPFDFYYSSQIPYWSPFG